MISLDILVPWFLTWTHETSPQRSCAFATAILASHAMVDAADETGTNETISLSTLQILAQEFK